MRLFVTVAAVLVSVILAGVPSYATPTLDGGWFVDQVSCPAGQTCNGSTPNPFLDPVGPSDGSPYVFTLTNPARFSITDAFVKGDIYTVYDTLVPILTTVPGPAPSG